MKTFEIAFEDENCNGEIYKVDVFDGYVRADSLHIADFKKNSSDGLRSFYDVRLKGEAANLPTKCYSLRTVAEIALTAHLLKGGILAPIEKEAETKTDAYALLIHWGDGSKSYLNEGDSLHTVYIDGKAIRLFRTREEADFAGKIQKMRNSYQKVETILLNLK